MGDQDTGTTSGDSGSTGTGSGTQQSAGTGSDINWQARAVTAEAALAQSQSDVEHWKGWSRKHEEASNGFRDNLTDLHRAKAIEKAAAEAGFQSPADALDLSSVRDAVRFNKDWQLAEGSADKLKESLTKVLADRPHWKRPEQGQQQSAGTQGIPGTAQGIPGYVPGFTATSGGTAEVVPSTEDIVKAVTARLF